jgi:uncharacterized protein YwqG
MNKEMYLFDDEKVLKFWSISPLNDESYQIEFGDFGSDKTVENKNYKSKEWLDNRIEYEEHISNIKAEGYRRISEKYLEPIKFNKLKELKNKLKNAGLTKKTWVPITEKKDGPILSSKFSGKPYLLKNEDWPLCGLCSLPLQLFVQLNLEELPEEKRIFGKGILQLFFCTNEENDCYVNDASFEINPPHQLIRIIDLSEENKEISVPQNHFPAKLITGWKYVGTEFSYLPSDFNDPNNSVLYFEYESEESRMISSNMHRIIEGEKIGGYPLFIQCEKGPNCQTCNKEMEFVLQIGSEVNIPFMFGDGGVGQIFICLDHKENIDFFWEGC